MNKTEVSSKYKHASVCKLKVNQKNTFLYSVDEGFGRIDGTNFNKIRLFIAHPLRNRMPYQPDDDQSNSQDPNG